MHTQLKHACSESRDTLPFTCLSPQGYGGGITPELVSSVKSSLRKTGIDLSPGASTETSLAAPAAAADDAAEESLDDSLDVEFL